MGFRILPHKADIMVEGSGKDFVSALVEVARGAVAASTRGETVDPAGEVPFSASGEDREELVVSFLNEVIYLLERGFVVADIDVEGFGEWWIKAKAKGQHKPDAIGLELKSATYYNLSIAEEEGQVTIRVVIDV